MFPVKEDQGRLYKSIQELFAPEYPKPGFGKIQTDFQRAQKVNKGHGRLEVRTIQTSECLIHMLAGRVWHKSIAWIVKSNGGATENVIERLAKSNLELQV